MKFSWSADCILEWPLLWPKHTICVQTHSDPKTRLEKSKIENIWEFRSNFKDILGHSDKEIETLISLVFYDLKLGQKIEIGQNSWQNSSKYIIIFRVVVNFCDFDTFLGWFRSLCRQLKPKVKKTLKLFFFSIFGHFSHCVKSFRFGILVICFCLLGQLISWFTSENWDTTLKPKCK